jgi:hypothetical protein
MVESTKGWLCLNCGHAEAHNAAATPLVPGEAAPVVADQPAPVAEAANAPASAAAKDKPKAASAPAKAPADSKPKDTPVPAPAITQAPATAAATPAATPAPVPAPVASNAPAPAAAPPLSAAVTPLTPKTHPRPFPVRRVVSVTATLAVLALLVTGGYLFGMEPGRALGHYAARVGNAATAHYQGTATVVTPSSHNTNSFAGDYNLGDSKSPQFGLTINGSSDRNDSYKIESRVVGQNAYVHAQKSQYLSRLLDLPIDERWYTLPTPSPFTAALACLKNAVATPDGLKISDAKWLGLSTSGGFALRYGGQLQLAGSSALGGCGLSSDQLKGLTASYEVSRGFSADRLRLVITDRKNQSSYDITLDTANYGKTVKIEAPADALTADQITAKTEAETQAAKALSGRNEQRKADIASYAAAYKAARKGSTYPAAPAKVKVSATDPATQKPYQIATTPPTAPGQIQYIAGGICGTAATPSTKSAKTLSLVTLLEDQPTPYCTDVK